MLADTPFIVVFIDVLIVADLPSVAGMATSL